MLYGLPEWKDGVIQRKAGTGEKDALLGIFADLGADLHNWLGWMAGHRAELLMAQGRENLLDANDIAALKGKARARRPNSLMPKPAGTASMPQPWTWHKKLGSSPKRRGPSLKASGTSRSSVNQMTAT